MTSERMAANPLLGTLELIFAANTDLEFAEYSTAEDFWRLWNLGAPRASRLVIVWSRTAPDPELSPINAADCLSPIDWAACFTAQRMDRPETWPDVMILDLDPAIHDRLPSVARLNALNPEHSPGSGWNRT